MKMPTDTTWGALLEKPAHEGYAALRWHAILDDTDPAPILALLLPPRWVKQPISAPAEPGAQVLPSRTPGLQKHSDVEGGKHRGCGALAMALRVPCTRGCASSW